MATTGFGTRRLVIAMAVIAVALPWQLARGSTGPVPRRQMRHEIFYRVRTNRPMVALTFDDGPDVRFTPQILEILHETGAHATFFVLGHRVLEHRDLIRRIVDEGNELGNHTMTHPHLTWLLGRDQEREITGGADALAQLGFHPVWFRPPYGLVSRSGVADASSLGERTVLWSLALDHEYRVHGSGCAARMLHTVKPGDIILSHDARPNTMLSLRRLLTGLRDRGIAVVTVSELVASSPPF